MLDTRMKYQIEHITKWTILQIQYFTQFYRYNWDNFIWKDNYFFCWLNMWKLNARYQNVVSKWEDNQLNHFAGKKLDRTLVFLSEENKLQPYKSRYSPHLDERQQTWLACYLAFGDPKGADNDHHQLNQNSIHASNAKQRPQQHHHVPKIQGIW